MIGERRRKLREKHTEREGGELVVLHVEFGEIRGAREDAERDLVDLVVLHVY